MLVEIQEEGKGSLLLSKSQPLINSIITNHLLTTHILTTHILTTHILTTHILTIYIPTMATLNIGADEIAVTIRKLQDVHISEAELPETPPAEDLHTKLTTVLLPQLSEKAFINLPSERLFQKHTSRWSDTTFTAPTAVVNVTSESDISAVVRLPPSPPFNKPM